MNRKIHEVNNIQVDANYLYITVDNKDYRIKWEECSSRLANATLAEKRHLEISPSGYGIHWPEIDEDLAIAPLIQQQGVASEVV